MGWFILLVLLFILIIALVPAWPYSRDWGYYPAGGALLFLLFLLFLIWFGYIAVWWPWIAAN